MPVEGRGLSSRQTQDVVRDLEIGQPNNSEACSEAADGVTRESEGGSRLSLLCPVRQDQPRRHPGACLCPVPLRRVFIPKANGKLRQMGISSVRDRVCMTAAMLVLEPIFEADLPPEIYAYRAGRNAKQAVEEVGELVFRGHPDVVDADLADYFGSIPHADLLKSVARRIVDRRVLHLIKMWLDCPVEETDERGRKTRTAEARDDRPGAPGFPAVKEEQQARGRKGPRADRPSTYVARNHRAGGNVEPHAARMGELLLSRHRHSGVSGARQLRGCAVAPVVALQAQDQTKQGR